MAKPEAPADDNERSWGENNKGVYLDEEMYLQAEDTLLRADGSLNVDERQNTLDFSYTSLDSPNDPPLQRINNKAYQKAAKGILSPAPSYSYLSNDKTDTRTGKSERLSKSRREVSDEARLYQTVADIEAGKQTISSEDLHQQVFAEEQAFLQQSEKFRKSLSTDGESAMAQKRRESFVQQNEKVLDRIMEGLDEMEKLAISRDGAISQSENSSSSAFSEGKDIICPKCGLRFTSDAMVRRPKAVEFTKGAMKNKESARPSVVMCQSCYREQLQTVDEARVRFGEDGFENSSSSAKMSNTKQWTGVKRYKNQQKRDTGTSSLFNMPQERDPGQKSGHLMDALRNEGIKHKQGSRLQSATPSLFDVPEGYEIKKKSRIKPEKSLEVPASSSTQLLGGRVLAERMQQQQSEISGAKYDEKSQTTRRSFEFQQFEKIKRKGKKEAEIKEINSLGNSSTNNKYEETGVADTIPFPTTLDNEELNLHNDEGSDIYMSKENMSQPNDKWVKVEDSGSDRIFYWNTETGEMKKALENPSDTTVKDGQ